MEKEGGGGDGAGLGGKKVEDIFRNTGFGQEGVG